MKKLADAFNPPIIPVCSVEPVLANPITTSVANGPSQTNYPDTWMKDSVTMSRTETSNYFTCSGLNALNKKLMAELLTLKGDARLIFVDKITSTREYKLKKVAVEMEKIHLLENILKKAEIFAQKEFHETKEDVKLMNTSDARLLPRWESVSKTNDTWD